MISRWCLVLTAFFILFDLAGQTKGKSGLSYSYDQETKSVIVMVPDGPDSLGLGIDSGNTKIPLKNGISHFPLELSRKGQLITLESEGKEIPLKLIHVSKTRSGDARIKTIPLWLSIIPPLVAIALALIFKEVIISLFVGIWSGAFIAGGLRVESPFLFLLSFFEVIEKYVIVALTDSSHLSVIVFSLLIGGMVAVISRNGGMAGVVKSLSGYATSPLRAQFITWLLGVAIFFDDYANTLVVGNTMRSVTDRFKVSREKLAYIVDSTAAPVAAVAFITTWIGAELGYIDGGIREISEYDFQMTPYAFFVSSLKYSFYPLLTLCFILLMIFNKRDFGPMYKAEFRARTIGQVSSAATPEEDEPNMEDLSPVKGAPRKWQHAFFPVLTVILVTIMGLVSTGMDALYSQLVSSGILVEESWGDIWQASSQLSGEQNIGFLRKVGLLVGSADSFAALLWASLSGATLAVVITLLKKIMNVIETMHSLVTGIKTMMPAIIILTLAWALALTTQELHTADFLSAAVANSIHPTVLPMLVFVLSALIAFSTGSSWSTMAILYPIAIPTGWAVCMAAGYDPSYSLEILLNIIATVLGASVLGDHCSPISDTTILSSLASDCNHIDHVRTQMPYALTVGTVSLACCGLSTALGGGWMISLMLIIAAIGTLLVIVRKVGKPIPDEGVNS